MRIDPTLPPPVGPRVSPEGAEPGRPFEDFLGDVVASGRAFGFAEFGMFGRDQQAQTPVPIPPPGKPPLESCNAVMPIEGLDGPIDGPGTPPLSSGESLVEPGQRPTRILATPEGVSRVPIIAIKAANGGAAAGPLESAPAEEEAASAPAATRRVARPQMPGSDVSLIISEKDGRVELIATGPVLDPESCALLRRLARAILARSGFDLAQFHLNGVPLTPDSLTMIGGTHGTRTR